MSWYVLPNGHPWFAEDGSTLWQVLLDQGAALIPNGQEQTFIDAWSASQPAPPSVPADFVTEDEFAAGGFQTTATADARYDPLGAADGVVAAHAALADPHSAYLTEATASGTYAPRPADDPTGDYGWLLEFAEGQTPPVQWTSSSEAVARALGWVIVTDPTYGSDPTGVADATASDQAAIDAVGAAGGGTVYWPPKSTFRHTAPLVVDAPGVILRGGGRSTIFTRSTDYGDTVLFTGNDATGTVLLDTGLVGIRFRSTGFTTSGAHVHYNGVTHHQGGQLYFDNGFIGIKAAGLTGSRIDGVYLVFTDIFGGSATGRRYMQFVSAAATYEHPSCGDLFVTDVNVRGNVAGTVTEAGIEVQSADGIWFQGGHVGNTTVANLLLNAIDATHPIGLLFFSQVMFDESTGRGLIMQGSAAPARNIGFTNCSWKGGTTGVTGIYAAAGAAFWNVWFLGGFVAEHSGAGVSLNSGIGFDFIGVQVRGNGYNTPGSAPGYALSGARKVRILGGCSGGDNVDPEIAKQSYGVVVNAGCVDIDIIGVDLRKNTVAPLIIDASARPEVTVAACQTDISTSVASASTLALPEVGEVFTVTGTTTIDNIAGTWTNRQVVLRFVGILSVTDAGNKKLSVALTTAVDTTLTLFYDGTSWIELARSVN